MYVRFGSSVGLARERACCGYLVCSCSGARCQRGSWCSLGLSGCSHPVVGTRLGSLCVGVPAPEVTLHSSKHHKQAGNIRMALHWLTLGWLHWLTQAKSRMGNCKSKHYGLNINYFDPIFDWLRYVKTNSNAIQDQRLVLVPK